MKAQTIAAYLKRLGYQDAEGHDNSPDWDCPYIAVEDDHYILLQPHNKFIAHRDTADPEPYWSDPTASLYTALEYLGYSLPESLQSDPYRSRGYQDRDDFLRSVADSTDCSLTAVKGYAENCEPEWELRHLEYAVYHDRHNIRAEYGYYHEPSFR
jgi:hypothetical protein